MAKGNGQQQQPHPAQIPMGLRNVLSQAFKPGEAQAPPDEKESARLTELISGKADPPNEYAKYIVEQIRMARASVDFYRGEINNGLRILEQMKKQLIAAEALNDRYLDDLRNWDKPVAAK